MQKITTESGAVYLYEPGRIKRLAADSDYEKRADGEWLTLYNEPTFKIGWRAFLVVRSLAALGPDDHGTLPENTDPYVTTRITTPVVRIEDQ